ncbi:MAG TPA: glutamate ABC transporter substrate-binding protein [Aeromicrobium sp.]|nr:glutamate ABC transporter substrate-binding protein [Aeromicrobium sp.]
MKTRRIAAAAISAAVVLGLAACGGSDDGDGNGGGDSGGDSVKIGIKFDQPGLGLKEGSSYSGFDVDVATYVAEKLGYDADDIEWVQSPSAQRETMIETGQVDFIVATYSITDTRKEKVDFAGPYFIAGQDLLVRADDSSITSVDDLSGKKLCSVTGSTSAQNVKDKVPGVNLQEFKTYSECLPALVGNAIDAVTTDDTILAGYASQAAYKGKLKVVGQPFSVENYGIGLKKGDTELCTKITDAITAMIEDGSWDKFVAANFGESGFQPGEGNPPTPAACS